MIRKIALTTALSVLALAAPFALTASESNQVEVSASETSHADQQAAADQNGDPHGSEVTDVSFPFEGPFGVYDRNQLQRGLQVYTEVCSACHGLKYVPIRTLGDKGGPELPMKQVRAYAANLAPVDDPDTGQTRDRKDSDFFPKSSDPQAPDLSLMAKARKGFEGPYGLGINQLLHGIGGPEYIYSILTHYTGKTKEQAGKTFYQNTTFPGGWIAMPPPLQDGQVEFADKSPNDVKHMAKDVAAFLMWTAEPKLDQRKKTGFLAVLFLAGLATLLYLTNKKLWAPLKRKKTRL